jgi:hypothetical protein
VPNEGLLFDMGLQIKLHVELIHHQIWYILLTKYILAPAGTAGTVIEGFAAAFMQP